MRRILFAQVLLILCGPFTGLLGQTTTVGSISGSVRDEQGAAIPKAEVFIQEKRTGFPRVVVTNDEGLYSAPSLPVGRYTVSTSPQGFKKTITSAFELHISENLVINLTVEVGPVSETVNVLGGAALVETQNSNVSSLISEKQVTELPLNGRNYSQLALMVPGVSPTEGFNSRSTGIDSGVAMSVNGNHATGNMWAVDGVNNLDVGSNSVLLVFPSIDSIQEFRVERNSYSAEFGQAQGAVINLISKGGGNEFHGTAFEFFRNDALNANNFFLNRAGQPKADLRYNNYGFNFNGPIVKKRAFFFWSEEWRRERRAFTQIARVPTAAERLGDFSGELTDPLPHDPANCRPDPADPQITICDPFPGNKIPASRLSPLGLALLQLYPDPNTSDPGFNWVTALLEPIDTRQDNLRGDVNINSKTNLMVRWINEDWSHGSNTTFWGDDPFPTVASDWSRQSKSLAVKLTNTFGSSSVNEFQFSRSGDEIFVTTNAAGQALNDELASKFQTVFDHPEGSSHPTLWAADGYSSLFHLAPWNNREDLFVWRDDFSKVIGAHNLKLGGLFSHNIKDETIIGGYQLYQICGTSTRTGHAIADLLLKDLPVGCYVEADHQEFGLIRWHDLEFYGNDSWKLNQRLTLNLGLRWSRYQHPYSANNRISNFIPELYDGVDPASGLVQASGPNRALVKNYNKGFQPRVGLAWDVFGDGKTSIRLGAGRYISRPPISVALSLAKNPPWTTFIDMGWGGSSSSLADDSRFRSLDTINPGLKDAVVTSSRFAAIRDTNRPPESWQWNLTISREVIKNTVVDVSYIGNHAFEIWRGLDWNFLVPSARAAVAQAIRVSAPNVNELISAGSRLPGVGPILMVETTGDSNYHALQIWANRRFSDRLAFQVAYTWSHAITNIPLQSLAGTTTDSFYFDRDRGDADLDRRHMLVTNFVYALPSFKRWGPVVKQILGDWQVNGIMSFLGGIPLDVYSGANTAGIQEAGAQRPNLVPGVPLYLPDQNDRLQYLNPNAFSLPGVGEFGSLGRGTIRAPRTINMDLSVAKNWRLSDRYSLQFRAEMFNALNRVNASDANIDTFMFLDGTEKFPDGTTNPNFGKSQNPNFGRMFSTRPAREIQFGVKFTF